MLLGLGIWTLDDTTHWVRLVWGPNKKAHAEDRLGMDDYDKDKETDRLLDETSS